MELLTYEAAKVRFGLSGARLTELTRRGVITKVKKGSERLVSLEDLRAYVNSKTEKLRGSNYTKHPSKK